MVNISDKLDLSEFLKARQWLSGRSQNGLRKPEPSVPWPNHKENKYITWNKLILQISLTVLSKFKETFIFDLDISLSINVEAQRKRRLTKLGVRSNSFWCSWSPYASKKKKCLVALLQQTAKVTICQLASRGSTEILF